MQKIRITSTANIENPKALSNIDISYGLSYYAKEHYAVKTLSEENSWRMKVLSKLDKLNQFFSKNDNQEDKEIIEEIIKNSDFVSKHENTNLENLHIQINAETKITKAISSWSEKKKKEHITTGIHFKAGSIYMEEKKMFLGLNLFKKGEFFYDNLIKNFTKQEAISFVFLHEYSHAAQIENQKKYIIESNNNGQNNLYVNVQTLLNDKIYDNLLDKLKKENNLESLPSKLLLKTISSLDKEIYADVGSILLMRNKAILEGTYTPENFENNIAHIIEVRKEEKRLLQKNIDNGQDEISHMMHDHFTSPGLENLSQHVKEMLGDDTNKILSEEEIHKISTRCIKEGMAKTIITLIATDNKLVGQLKVLFSMRMDVSQVEPEHGYIDMNKGVIELQEDKNYYKESIDEMKTIVPETWKQSFKERIISLNELSDIYAKKALKFDAGLDIDNFNKNLSNKLALNKELEELLGDDEPVVKNENKELETASVVKNINDIKKNIASLRKQNSVKSNSLKLK